MALRSDLTSGVNFVDDNQIQKGIDSLTRSLMAIEQGKIDTEEEKIEKFQQLINISFEPVQGRFRDEAIAKRDEFLADTKAIAQETQGNITWKQTKQIEAQRKGLEQSAGKYKEIKEWYSEEFRRASKIKDKTAMTETLRNIGEILNKGGNLDETYAKIQDPKNWYVEPKEETDVHYTLNQMNAIYREGSLRQLLELDPKVQNERDAWLKINEDKTEEDFIKYKTIQHRLLRPDKITTPKTKQLPIVKEGKGGGFAVGGANEGRGVKLSSFSIPDKTAEGGFRTLKNVNVAEIKPIKKKFSKTVIGYEVILHVPKLTGRSEEEIKADIFKAAKSEEEGLMNFDIWKLQNPSYTQKVDPIEKEIIKIPIEDIWGILKQSVNLKGIDESLIGSSSKELSKEYIENSLSSWK